jgi:hypothetical protein
LAGAALRPEVAELAAQAAGGFVDRYFRVAEDVVRVRCAGAALASEITGAMSHLEVEPGPDQALTVLAWSGRSSPLTASDEVRRGLGADGVSFVQWGPASVSALDAERGLGYLWVRSPVARETRVAALSPILAAWLPSRDVVHPHARAGGDDRGCGLLGAPSGRGKSTTAAACVEAGMRCAGDDTCLVKSDPAPTVYSLYRLAQSVADGASAKDIRELPACALLREGPLRAIAVIEPSGRAGTRVSAIGAGAALAAMAPSSMLRLPVPRDAVLRGLARIARSTPCHRVEAGTDRKELAAAVGALL